MAREARPGRAQGTGAPAGGGVPRGRGGWAVALLAAGLLATLPVLTERVRVEAGYRTVALVAEVPGGGWDAVLPGLAPALREQGVHALVLPAEALEDVAAVSAVRASGFPILLFWTQGPASEGEVVRRLREAEGAGLAVELVGGVGPSDGRPGDSPVGGSEALIAVVEMEAGAYWSRLAREEPGRAVTAHWIAPEDRGEYRDPGGRAARVARYLRAARERQVRVLIVTVSLLSDPPGEPGDLAEVADRLREQGFTLGRPAPLPPFRAGPIQRFLMGAAVGAALILAAATLRPAARAPAGRGGRILPLLGVTAPIGLGIVALLPPIAPAGGAGEGLSGAALVAFLAAVAFPVWAVLSLRKESGSGGTGFPPPPTGWVRALLLSLAGGLLVAGLLSSREALLRLELFRGVKAMHVVPPILVAGMLLPGPLRAFLGARREATGRAGARRGAAWIGPGLGLLLLVAVAAAGLYYVGRTGNELVPVPGWERELRDEIEAVLGARPRFKELFGHAALFAGLAVLAAPGSRPARRGAGGPEEGRGPLAALVGAVLLVAGTAGQLSVVNSLSHLHQPLLLTLQRVAYGGVGGLVLGVLLAAAARWGLAWWERWAVGRTAGTR